MVSLMAKWCVVLTALSGQLAQVLGGTCDVTQISDQKRFLDAQQSNLTQCFADLKLPTDGAITLDKLITESNLQQSQLELICESNKCQWALIAAMETLPDCCATTIFAQQSMTNLPRLASDILDQCDHYDARMLAQALQKEVAKLPDLKVQIKGVVISSWNNTNGNGGAFSGSMYGNSSVNHATGNDSQGIDLVVDVKKREILKSNPESQKPNSNQGIDDSPASSLTAFSSLCVSVLAMAMTALL